MGAYNTPRSYSSGGYAASQVGAAWTPANLANKVIWVKSDTGITASPVASWADQSGQGNDLTQSDPTKRPTLVANQLNGYSAVVFDGISQTMRTLAFGLTQPVSIFMVAKQITWSSGGSLCDGTVDNSGRIFQYTGSPRIDMYSGAFGPTTNNLAVNTFSLITSIFDGASSKLQINSLTESTGNPGNTSMLGFVLGSFATGATAFCNLAVCEVIVMNAVATAEDRANIHLYVAARYGI